ncbi:hypothetical protein NL676_023703 [Syzygium grande]|nr:hypothetical protein NL676_023703 [Syzygium grande]
MLSKNLPCPRCSSTNTESGLYWYKPSNLSQPRHLCKSCHRYWTHSDEKPSFASLSNTHELLRFLAMGGFRLLLRPGGLDDMGMGLGIPPLQKTTASPLPHPLPITQTSPSYPGLTPTKLDVSVKHKRRGHWSCSRRQ